MKIYNDVSLTSLGGFEFWGGAVEKAVLFTDKELETIEQNLIELFPCGMEDVKINDIFWFEPETLCEWVGITEEELFEREEIA